MATVYKEFTVAAGVDSVWEALRDFGAVHERLAPGFVIDCHLEQDARVVNFANGLVAREMLVGIDEQARRLCYSISISMRYVVASPCRATALSAASRLISH